MSNLTDSLELPRLRVVVATIIINIVAVALLAFAPWSDWKTGLGLNVIDNVLLLAFMRRHNDVFLARLMVFGVVVGIAELAADAWLVDWTRTLDYSIGGGPMLWRSPIWMPLAWQVVAVQFGCLGLWLWQRFGGRGLVAIGVLGAINIPYYEEMAKLIHWWRYSGCRMVSNTPHYIIVGELIIAVGFTLLAKPLRGASMTKAAGIGVAGGLVIFVAYAVAYGITDGFVRG